MDEMHHVTLTSAASGCFVGPPPPKFKGHDAKQLENFVFQVAKSKKEGGVRLEAL